MIPYSTLLNNADCRHTRVPRPIAASQPDGSNGAWPSVVRYPSRAPIHDLELGHHYLLAPPKKVRPSNQDAERRNKVLAKRSFQFTLAFGILTLIYEAVSILPAFHSSSSAAQGVDLQAKSEWDSRQALTFSFLAECANRKVNFPRLNFEGSRETWLRVLSISSESAAWR